MYPLLPRDSARAKVDPDTGWVSLKCLLKTSTPAEADSTTQMRVDDAARRRAAAAAAAAHAAAALGVSAARTNRERKFSRDAREMHEKGGTRSARLSGANRGNWSALEWTPDKTRRTPDKTHPSGAPPPRHNLVRRARAPLESIFPRSICHAGEDGRRAAPLMMAAPGATEPIDPVLKQHVAPLSCLKKQKSALSTRRERFSAGLARARSRPVSFVVVDLSV